MDDSVGMCGSEGGANGFHDGQSFFRRQTSTRREQVIEREAGEIVHDKKWRTVGEGSDFANFDDVGMAQTSQQIYFTNEASDHFGHRSERRMENFDGDGC